MSDTPQQYILRQPIEGIFRSPEYYGKEVYEVVLKTETLMHRFQPVAKDVFEAMYQLLDIEALRQQIADIMDELGEYRDVEAYFRKQDEAVDAVLRVCGLTQEETDV